MGAKKGCFAKIEVEPTYGSDTYSSRACLGLSIDNLSSADLPTLAAIT